MAASVLAAITTFAKEFSGQDHQAAFEIIIDAFLEFRLSVLV